MIGVDGKWWRRRRRHYRRRRDAKYRLTSQIDFRHVLLVLNMCSLYLDIHSTDAIQSAYESHRETMDG
jgi:hypothetical protein